jgi:hypothetical protein
MRGALGRRSLRLDACVLDHRRPLGDVGREELAEVLAAAAGRLAARVSEVCRHVRSKNAGPFWITIDLSFRDAESYARHVDAPALQPAAIARLYDVDATQVKRFPIPELLVLKISYPRCRPQGGAMERDMHGGQQYVRLLDLEV